MLTAETAKCSTTSAMSRRSIALVGKMPDGSGIGDGPHISAGRAARLSGPECTSWLKNFAPCRCTASTTRRYAGTLASSKALTVCRETRPVGCTAWLSKMIRPAPPAARSS
jgi:hypothetical protein